VLLPSPSSGLLFGILLARVSAGIIAEFTSWRVVYYFAVGVQALVLVGSYWVLPDYPSKNKDLTYWTAPPPPLPSVTSGTMNEQGLESQMLLEP
jgi:hypothetical protein